MSSNIDVYWRRANALLEKAKQNGLTKDEKIMFRNDLEHFIENANKESDKTYLARAYSLRGEIHSGLHPEVCD